VRLALRSRCGEKTTRRTVQRHSDGRLLVLDADWPAEEEADAPVDAEKLGPEPPPNFGLLSGEAPARAIDMQALRLREADGEAHGQPSLEELIARSSVSVTGGECIGC
jgi:hypothetical protein